MRRYMEFFSKIGRSIKKSSRLRKLQKIISPPGQTEADLLDGFLKSLRTGSNKKTEALKEYLDLCQSDEGVAQILREYHLTKEDLEQIYSRLLANGLGQWIKGHYIALSTIAYYEPLLYFVESEKQGTESHQIFKNLFGYWNNEITQGGLISIIQSKVYDKQTQPTETNEINVKLKSEAWEVNGLLSDYIKFHNYVNKEAGSLKSLLKKVDFDELFHDAYEIYLSMKYKHEELIKLKEEILSCLTKEQNDFFQSLITYSSKLVNTTNILSDNLLRMSEAAKDRKNKKLSWEEFKENQDRYQESIKEYLEVGGLLNKIFHIVEK